MHFAHYIDVECCLFGLCLSQWNNIESGDTNIRSIDRLHFALFAFVYLFVSLLTFHIWMGSHSCVVSRTASQCDFIMRCDLVPWWRWRLATFRDKYSYQFHAKLIIKLRHAFCFNIFDKNDAFHTIFCIFDALQSWCTSPIWIVSWCFDRMKMACISPINYRRSMGKWARTWEIDRYRRNNEKYYILNPKWNDSILLFMMNEIYMYIAQFHERNEMASWQCVIRICHAHLTGTHMPACNKNRWMTFNFVS